ncbi:MAG: hypothetical protein WB952_06590 [Terriglobales bacterium]
MMMLFCPNCQTRRGFKRSLGFGTFFMVVITCGLWLLIIPLYPVRCMTCGTTRSEVITEAVSRWPEWAKILLFAAGMCAVGWLISLGSHSQDDQPAPIIKGPDYNELPRRTTAPSTQVAESKSTPDLPEEAESVYEPGTLTSTDNSESHEFRADGRVYSVALVATASAEHEIPLHTKVLTQGTLSFLPFSYAFGVLAFLRDEQQRDKVLICVIETVSVPTTEYEAAKVRSFYRDGSVVEISGEYTGTDNNLSKNAPVLQKCRVASPTQGVVRHW